jgi:hypothetical protein
MTLTERFNRIEVPKFSFGKNTEHAPGFAKACGAMSMYDDGYGLQIPNHLSDGNRLRAVFLRIMGLGGLFLFNISGVDMKRAYKGFSSFEDAEANNQITEWELFMILGNRDYKKNCIFHNGKVAFKKTILWKSIQT